MSRVLFILKQKYPRNLKLKKISNPATNTQTKIIY